MSRTVFERKFLKRPDSSGGKYACAMFGVITALLSAIVAEAGDTLSFGKLPVGFPALYTNCFCITSPSGQSATFSSVSIGGTGAANYSITNDACTGHALTGTTCPNTFAECQSQSSQSPTNTCLFDIAAEPLHPGPVPAATIKESLNGGSRSDQFALNAIGGIIVAPVDSTKDNLSVFSLSTPQTSTDPGSVPITFTAANLQAGDAVAWKATTSYRSGRKSVPSSVKNFNGSPNQSITQQFTGIGGNMTVKATAENYTDTATVYIVGPSSSGSTGDVPYGLITSELDTLYQDVTKIPTPSNPTCSATGAFQPFPASTNPPDTTKTSGLATQVAMNESNYLQFVDQTLYGVLNFWPNGSVKHVGLMQVPASIMDDAWNWVQNAQDGVAVPNQNSLQCKIGTAHARELAIEAAAKNSLPTLDACQLEEMALELYGPKPGGTNLAKQYYSKHCVGGTSATCQNGSWQWQINTTRNLCGVCYIISVRNEVPPTGGSVTSCQPPTGISADPPTNLNSLCCAKCKGLVNMTDIGCK